ncbi:MAG: hypothetical protein FWG99_09315 [Treponema sp.]|nr:hypothetical protein [Treponema sp.]
MKFYRLSAAFYRKYCQFDEILTKENRPYYVLLLELDGLTYAIPLRSHITHPHCFIADNTAGLNSGVDYSKAVVITEKQFIDSSQVTIRQNEFNIYKKREYHIRKQFSSYVAHYKKEVRRRLLNPTIPISALCRFSSLKYFHKELGLQS